MYSDSYLRKHLFLNRLEKDVHFSDLSCTMHTILICLFEEYCENAKHFISAVYDRKFFLRSQATQDPLSKLFNQAVLELSIVFK